MILPEILFSPTPLPWPTLELSAFLSGDCLFDSFALWPLSFFITHANKRLAPFVRPLHSLRSPLESDLTQTRKNVESRQHGA
jgi:hypothetical protein